MVVQRVREGERGLADGGQQDRASQPRSLGADPVEREEGGLSIYKLKKC